MRLESIFDGLVGAGLGMFMALAITSPASACITSDCDGLVQSPPPMLAESCERELYNLYFVAFEFCAQEAALRLDIPPADILGKETDIGNIVGEMCWAKIGTRLQIYLAHPDEFSEEPTPDPSRLDELLEGGEEYDL